MFFGRYIQKTEANPYKLILPPSQLFLTIPMPEPETLPLSLETKQQLSKLRRPEETWDELLGRLIRLANATEGFSPQREDRREEYASLNDDPEYLAIKKEMQKLLGLGK